MAEPQLNLDDEHMDQIFDMIDIDKDGCIGREEMEKFIKTMMLLQGNLKFK